MQFEDAFKLLIGNEGGYTNDTRDRGNWTGGKQGKGVLKGTKYGISAMAYPDVDIKSLTLGQAQAIYKRDYWDACGADNLPESIRFDVFDTAVNSGVARAKKILQAAIGVVADGVIGPVTLATAQAMDAQRLDKRFNAERLRFVSTIGGKEWELYGKGWVVRIAGNMEVD